MKNYYDVEMIGVPGLSMPIEKPIEYNNDFNFNIILNEEIVGTFRIIEMMGDLNMYFLDVNFNATEEQALDFYDFIITQCKLQSLPGLDEPSYTLLFGSEYETVKFYELLNIKPGQILYRR